MKMEQNVQIVELNAENWYDCCELQVSPEQKKIHGIQCNFNCPIKV
ncbi:hypothetical protein LSPH24S_04176 [Lysinibacillus sphaericus]